MMKENYPYDEAMRYQIKIMGNLDQRWADWFNGMKISTESCEPPVTVLTGVVKDQAALRGVLYKIWNLNLALLSVIPLDAVTTSSQHDEGKLYRVD